MTFEDSMVDNSTVGIGNARLYGMEEELNMGPNQYQLAVSILFVTYCVSRNEISFHGTNWLTLISSCSKLPPTLLSRR